MHGGYIQSRLLWPHYNQEVQEAAPHLPAGNKEHWPSAQLPAVGAGWTEVFLVPAGT